MATHLGDTTEPVLSASQPNMPDGQPASIQERDFFYQRLETALDDSGFFTVPEMAASVKRNIRALFSRAKPSVQELSTLHGIVQALKRQRK
jgi:tRNA/rRNA methyltransferase